MSNYLTVFINDEPVYKYNRDTSLDDKQLGFLDSMDADMQKGIKIRGELIEQPGAQQRLTFMALNLVKALQQDDQGKCAVSCAYLLSRQAELTEVRVSDGVDGVEVEFL